MDLREAKLILEKINRLFDSMALDERKVDSFEQDLMLSYTKQFYDSFSYEKENAVPQPIRRKAPPKIIVEQAAPVVVPPAVVTPPPPPAPKVIKEVPVPEMVEVAEPVHEPVPVAPPSPVAAPKPAAVPVAAEAPKPAPAPTPVIIKPSAPTLAPNMAALFSNDNSNELSHKLSQQPIADLTKAIGINERILTINELFDKDTVFFNEIMKKINNLANFDDAQKILVQLAQKFDWLADDKQKKAAIFIKLIRRRFL